jgi:CrcB protein
MLATWPPLLLVALGGATGSCLRYLTGRLVMGVSTGWPWGTFAVNLAGGVAMGLLAGLIGRASDGGEPVRLLLGVGLLGGFTTFSAFSLETYNMLVRGESGLAAAYVLLSVVGGVGGVWAGVMLGRLA